MDWKSLVLNACKSTNHFLVLESLYEKPVRMKGIKVVNYKTTARIVKGFLKQGLVTKYNDTYSLSNTGRLLATFILGKFTDLKPGIKTDFVLDKDEAYIERKQVIEEVIYNLARKRSTIILGESGSGKTTLIKHLQADYLKNSVLVSAKPASMITEKLASHLSIPLVTTKGRRKRIQELMDDITRKVSDDLVLIIDEVEDSTKQTIKLIKELQRAGITILGAGTGNKGLNFNSEIRLKGLSKEEAGALINQLLKDSGVSSEFIKELSNLGNPERIKNSCNDLIITQNMGELDNNKASIKRELKQKQLRKINLISTYHLVSIGYLLITLRYVFYGQKQYQIGYLFSTAAYFIFFLFRRRGGKKKK